MDKPSERKKDHKSCGDTDIGVHDYKAGGKREQLDGLWSIPSKAVVGLGPERLITNEYCKEVPGYKQEKVDLMDELLENGPPMLNVSAPKRVL